MLGKRKRISHSEDTADRGTAHRERETWSKSRYVYTHTLRLIGTVSYLDACYIRTKVTKALVRKCRCTFLV